MPKHDPARDAFGRRLRSERESRGITLRHIADSTKIKASLLADLEEGDVSKWPEGIYRRAYLCSYLAAIGVAVPPVLAEFTKLFPNHTDEPPAVPFHGIGLDTHESVDTDTALSDLLDRVWVTVFDLAAVCLLSSVTALITGLDLSLVMALTAAIYIAVGSVAFAHTIGSHVQSRMHRAARAARPSQAVKAQAPVARLVATGKARESRPAIEVELAHGLPSRRASA